MPSASGRGFARRLIPQPGLSRALATQGLLSRLGEGTFETGSAVFLTQVIGMSAARAGLALTVMGVAQFVAAYPAGRLVDRVGARGAWTASCLGVAAVFSVLPFVTTGGQYLVAAVAMGVFEALNRTSSQAYIYNAVPRTSMIETRALIYSWMNLGFTVGAMLGGFALAVDSLEVVRWTPAFAAAITLANGIWIARLPAAARPAVAPEQHDPGTGTPARGPGPLRNPGWILGSFFTGVLWTNQTLLTVVIPLWLVEATDAPRVLLAWLFGTNTALCIVLPAYTSKGVRSLDDAMRYFRISSGFFVLSCLITMVTHSTVGLVTVVLVWVGHVTVTGAELALSAAGWTFEAELSDPRRRGEYQGVQEVASALGFQWAPAVYTFLAISWGSQGWLVIAGIVLAAMLGLSRAIPAGRRFADRHFPPPEVRPEGVSA